MGQGCGIIRDYTNPVVRLPESVADGANLNPTDPDAIETVSASFRALLLHEDTWRESLFVSIMLVCVCVCL